jgi:hypothetical protein
VHTNGTGMGGECPQISQMNADLLKVPTGWLCLRAVAAGRQFLIRVYSWFLLAEEQEVIWQPVGLSYSVSICVHLWFLWGGGGR